jgi:hypothetical protein
MKQRNYRLANIEELPNSNIFACPKCGGTDWAITTAYVDGVEEHRPELMLMVILASTAVVGAIIYLVLQAVKWPLF